MHRSFIDKFEGEILLALDENIFPYCINELLTSEISFGFKYAHIFIRSLSADSFQSYLTKTKSCVIKYF